MLHSIPAIPNEILFIFQALFVAAGSICMLRLGSGALTAYVGLLGIFSNVLISKQITFFSYTVTATDSLAVGMILGMNLLQEYFGKAAARKALYSNFALVIVYLGISQLHLLYTPAPVDSQSVHYAAIFSIMPRIIIASIISYTIVQYLDNTFYRFLRNFFQKKYFSFRNVFSLVLSQFLDTVLFTYLGLYGNVENVWHIIIFSYFIKLGAVVCFIPLITLIKKLFPHDAENI